MSTASSHNVWFDAGWWIQQDGTRRLLSWNAATHELKLWAIDRRQDDLVLAVIDTEEEVRRRLDGWEQYNTTKEGMTWLAQRLDR